MITPEQLAKSGSEDGHQAALFCWIALNKEEYPELDWAFAVPNGGKRDKRTANRLKATGVKSGVPDIFLPVRRGHFPGLWVELKRPELKPKREGSKGGVSDEQNEYKKHLISQGYGVYVAYGYEDARDTMIAYLNYGK